MRQIYFHIGDFYDSTRHCSHLERLVQLDCVFLCYKNEAPLPEDTKKLCRLLSLTSPEEQEALRLVLEEFWTLGEDGYHNRRCDEEIAKYHAYKAKKSKAGKASAAARRKNPTGEQQGDPTGEQQGDPTGEQQGDPTAEQQTVNRKPKTENHTKTTCSAPSEEVTDPVVIGMPTNRFNTVHEEFPVTVSMVTEWQEAFPSLDVSGELPKIRAWLLDNQPKRKTAKGMRKFIGSWLSRQHDQGVGRRPSTTATIHPLAAKPTRGRTLDEDLKDTSWAK